MLLFNNITWYSLVAWFVVLGALILINEFARKSKVFSVILCVVMPIVLTVFVWPHTAGEGSSTGTWFHWVKVYSALAGCLIFMGIRYFKSWKDNKYILMLPAIILAVNILEAVVRDFQCYVYAGAALLISCTLPLIFIKKGVWIQNRAYTLAAWMMFTMTFPSFVDTSIFAVQSSHNAKALLIVSIISLLSNIIVFIYHFYKIFKYKRNPFKEDVHFDLKAFSATLFEATINNSI